MYQRLKSRALGAFADLVTYHPVAVLVSAALMVLASLVITLLPVPIPLTSVTLGPLAFQSNRNDLISPELDWNKRFIDWQKQYSGTTDLVIVADAGDPSAPEFPDRALAVRKLIDDLGPELDKNPWVTQAVWGFHKLKVSPKALRIADFNEKLPTDDFRSRLFEVSAAAPLLSSQTPAQFIGRVIQQQMQSDHEDITEDQAVRSLRSFRSVLEAFNASLQESLVSSKVTDIGRLVVAGEEGGLWQYLVSENNRLYFIRVTPKHDLSQINALAPAIASVRQILADVSTRHPGVDAGLTGIDVVETDETDAATWDGTLTSILAVLVITTLMITAYHSIRMPLMHTTSLLTAVAWTFGFTTLAVGHLQVISVVFVPLLLGLGIAYGIYLTSRFELIRHDYPDTPEGFSAAMRDTYRTMGPGILTGCLTTALAFMTTMLTDFTGVAEMGLISGVGILLCLLSMFTVFPAMLRLIKPGHEDIVPLEKRTVRFYKDRWFMPFARHPKITLALGALLTLLSLFSLKDMTFDYNLLKLQPEGLPSVEWERRIVEDAGESIWFGVTIVKDLEEARAKAAQYRKLDTVRVVRGIGLLIPEDEARKIELLKQARADLDADLADAAAAPAPPMELPLAFQLSALRMGFDMQLRGRDIPASIKPELEALRNSIDGLLATLSAIPAGEQSARLDKLNTEFLLWRQETRKMVDQALDTTPLTLDDLPAALLAPYRGKDGTLSLEIFPRLPDPATSPVRDVLDPAYLPVFISQMRSVDPNVSGVAIQIYESGVLIRDSYIFAGALGMVLVLIVLMFDFQSWRDGLVALIPVIVGFAVTFGIMRLAGMSINAANIIVLPLMFGIGVDSGVHLIYRWRMDPDGQPPGLTQGTGLGVVIVNMTTILGFSMMAIPYIPFLHIGVRHRGIQSLGMVLTIGMLMTLLACLTVMPAWLSLRNNRRKA